MKELILSHRGVRDAWRSTSSTSSCSSSTVPGLSSLLAIAGDHGRQRRQEGVGWLVCDNCVE
eukprot:13398149-Heterocapsa_arctica.AAC.1